MTYTITESQVNLIRFFTERIKLGWEGDWLGVINETLDHVQANQQLIAVKGE